MLVRGLDRVLPGGDVFAGVAAQLRARRAAICVIGLLARELFGERVGYRTMLLMAFFPGSFVLSFTYSEATLIVARRRLPADAAARAVGGGRRARRDRHRDPPERARARAPRAPSPRSSRSASGASGGRWSLPCSSPVGFVAFQCVPARCTPASGRGSGSRREAWDEGTSFGLTALRQHRRGVRPPAVSPTDIVTAVSFLVMIVLLWVMWQRRLPWPLVAYVLVVLALMILPSTVTARPRFLYTAFPLFISRRRVVAGASTRRRGALSIALCAAGLVTLTGLYGVLGAIP